MPSMNPDGFAVANETDCDGVNGRSEVCFSTPLRSVLVDDGYSNALFLNHNISGHVIRRKYTKVLQ